MPATVTGSPKSEDGDDDGRRGLQQREDHRDRAPHRPQARVEQDVREHRRHDAEPGDAGQRARSDRDRGAAREGERRDDEQGHGGARRGDDDRSEPAGQGAADHRRGGVGEPATRGRPRSPAAGAAPRRRPPRSPGRPARARATADPIVTTVRAAGSARSRTDSTTAAATGAMPRVTSVPTATPASLTPTKKVELEDREQDPDEQQPPRPGRLGAQRAQAGPADEEEEHGRREDQAPEGDGQGRDAVVLEGADGGAERAPEHSRRTEHEHPASFAHEAHASEDVGSPADPSPLPSARRPGHGNLGAGAARPPAWTPAAGAGYDVRGGMGEAGARGEVSAHGGRARDGGRGARRVRGGGRGRALRRRWRASGRRPRRRARRAARRRRRRPTLAAGADDADPVVAAQAVGTAYLDAWESGDWADDAGASSTAAAADVERALGGMSDPARGDRGLHHPRRA